MPGQLPMSTTPDALYYAGTLLRLVRTLDQQLRAATGPDSLTTTELGVLGQIDHGVDLPSLLARTLRLDPARVTHVADRLVARGYIVRAVDPRDRRCWRLHLTPLGRQRLEEGRADVRAAMEALLGGLTEEERTGLLRGLEGVRRLVATE
ncbi:MAG TPA: MarR family transcriptional regulator [Chloroflexota bacterium]|nr:MarR family transcriptional regulator [Chloroflexota bacterium]